MLESDDIGPTETRAVRPEPAVATLGSGNLSLSHLGISEETSTSMLPVNYEVGRGRSRSIVQSIAAVSKGEEMSAAEAVSAAYSEKPPVENLAPVVTDTAVPSGRPGSITSAVGSTSGDLTPPRASPGETEGGGGGIHRSGSVRSRISAKAKRHRGSSIATGSAIAAALAIPGAPQEPRQSLVGTKRNKDFHQLFRSVPEDDTLVEDYSAALQRDILLQGRLYVSEKHICFASNILGWVTHVVMNFDEVISMEKRMTAKIFPNAIHIQTLHAKHFFASLLSREATYDLLVGQWKVGHPNVRVSATGHELDESGIKGDNLVMMGDSESGSDAYSASENGSSDASSHVETEYLEAGEVIETTKVPRKTSFNGGSSPAPTNGAAGSAPTLGDFPGPATHTPTECEDQSTHFEKQVMDTTIPAPLGKVYSMMFGPLSGQVMRKFLLDDQKSGDLQMEDDKRGVGEEVKTFTYSFIKPLGGAIGPKQTRCLVTQTLDHFDLDKAVSVTCSTQTPDVPSGNVFVTKTKYCLTWGPGNSTRFVMGTAVEWSGKSWLKSPIEKGAGDGQILYGKDITNFLKAQVSSTSSAKPILGRPRSKTKGRKKRSGTDATDIVVTKTVVHDNSTARNWGVLEPLHPIVDILGSLVSPSIALAVLLTLVTLLWIRSAYFTRSSDRYAVGNGNGRHQRASAAAVYEDLWHREESELWTWLEDRLDLVDLTSVTANGAAAGGANSGLQGRGAGAGTDEGKQRRVQLQSREMESRLWMAAQEGDRDAVDERKIAEAIRVTQENLDALKLAKQRRAAKAEGKKKGTTK